MFQYTPFAENLLTNGADGTRAEASSNKIQMSKVNQGDTSEVIRVASVQLEPFSMRDNESATTGDDKATLIIPSHLDGMNLTRVFAFFKVAGSGGATTIQVRNATDGVNMLDTALTVDADEVSSATAENAASIDTDNDDVSTNDEIAIDYDGVPGTAPQGGIVILEFQDPS